MRVEKMWPSDFSRENINIIFVCLRKKKKKKKQKVAPKYKTHERMNERETKNFIIMTKEARHRTKR